MSLRTAVFVDGANFRGNLRDFSFASDSPTQTRRYRLEERHFDWENFFDGVITKFNCATGWEHQLIRVHWYHAESISPWIASESERLRLARRVVDRHPEIHGLTPRKVIDLAHNWYVGERNYFERLREDVFEDIQRRTDFLEFKYVGRYQVHPLQEHRIRQDENGQISYLGVQRGEKGVDTGIAVDMIAKMPYYDVAIPVSGDADFLPVVGYLKDHLKNVYQFSVAKGVPPSIRYLSAYLKGKVDCFASYDEAELLSTYLIRTSGIPPAILDAIDTRITQLSS